MTDKQALANRIRSARALSGLSQGQAAKLMNLHRPTISEIEAGRRNVKTDELTAFSNLYGVEVSWLVSGEVEKEKLDKSVIAAARELSSMKEEDLDILMSTIQVIKSKGKHDKKD
jgi:transcriptional regulator with XRE-family HTH domain